MKRCPECRRDYYDETLMYCLDDGNALLEGPATAESKTETLPLYNNSAEAKTRSFAEEEKFATHSPSRSVPSERIVLVGGNRVFVALISGIVILAGLSYGIYRLTRTVVDSAAVSQPSSLKLQAMTASGNIREAAISPDGRFLAYTEEINGKAAVWTKQISTNSKVQITEPTAFDYFSLSFSKDGDHVYYGLFEGTRGVLYRVPTLGGTPVKIMDPADGRPSFSPDGKQFAVEVYDLKTGISSIVVANSDGSNARPIITRDGQQYFLASSVTWSPDGKLIAVAAADDSVGHPDVMCVINIDSGELREFGKSRFDVVNAAEWLNDMSGLIFVASDKGSNVPRQLWKISYPQGEARQISHDLAGYTQLSMTADGKSLVTVQREIFGSVWFSKDGDLNKGEQISQGRVSGTAGMTVTLDKRVVYVSNITGAIELWSVNLDGSGARQLTNDGVSKYTPAASPDGRFIVFISEKGGKHIWRINTDGSGATQISFGSEEANPRVSADSKWIIFDSYRSGKIALWRMPIDGGEPRMISDAPYSESDVSPDGNYIACFLTEAGKNIQIAIIPFEGGPAVKTFDVPPTTSIDSSVTWMPDGKAVTYIDWQGNISNLWSQFLDGGPPRQLTNYKQGYIYRREWTRDGKSAVYVKGTETSDAVLITDFK